MLGTHQVMLGVRWVFKRIGAGFSRLISQGKEGEPIEMGKIIIHRNRQQIIGKDEIVGGKEKEDEKHA